jgi:hypothetical protein
MASLKKVLYYLCAILLVGCSGMEHSELEKLKKMNARGEFVHRNHDEYHYAIATPEHHLREKYPWEMTYIGKHARITKEYFPI